MKRQAHLLGYCDVTEGFSESLAKKSAMFLFLLTLSHVTCTHICPPVLKELNKLLISNFQYLIVMKAINSDVFVEYVQKYLT